MSAYSAAVLADMPLSYWKLDETSGTSAEDQMSAASGTYIGGPALGLPTLVQSDPGFAVSFNEQVKQRAEFGNVYGFVSRACFSAEAWAAYTIASNTVGVVVAKWENAVGGWSIGLGDNFDGMIYPFADRRGGNEFLYPGGLLANDGAAHHLVETYDGTTLKLFVDGVSVVSDSSTLPQSPTSVPMTIGLVNPLFNNGDPVVVDEVAVYDHALTAARVLAHYNAALTAPTLIQSTDQPWKRSASSQWVRRP
jgi:hypothetical protein